jgi:hypothetical protein
MSGCALGLAARIPEHQCVLGYIPVFNRVQVTVFFKREAITTGPTPPGTGVKAETVFITDE